MNLDVVSLMKSKLHMKLIIWGISPEEISIQVDFQHFRTPSSINSREWKNHPGNQINRDQGGSSTRPQQQMPSLYDQTTKLEKTLAQFMQVSMSNQKRTKSIIKNLEVQVVQLAKQLAERSSNIITANTEKS